MKKHSCVIIVSLIIFVLTISINSINSLIVSVSEQKSKENPKTSIISDKIHINNNWTETKSAGTCTGAGTESNPYTLTNLIIDVGGIGRGILIENTTEYFKIENCTIFNSGGEYRDAGITLINVRNGEIINNTFYDNYRGMSIWSSLNLIFVMNRMFHNEYGMEMFYTNNSIFYLNSFVQNSKAQLFFQWSWNQYNSQEMFSYTYNGSSFTNYLGNYWEGYTVPDEDGDGIGDLPYMVDPYVIGNPKLRDYYPLIEPIGAYSNIKKVINAIPGFNVFNLLGVIAIIMVLLIITNRKSLNK